MFTREETSRMKEEFWTTFGRYMSPVPSADGVKINWVNYHTTVKDVYFRMDAQPRLASICISIESRDLATQALVFRQFEEFKTLLHTTVDEEWQWQLHVAGAGKITSRICKSILGVSVLNKDHWPVLISFFKPRIIALDSFWVDAKYKFDV